jgi:hypothetical protein
VHEFPPLQKPQRWASRHYNVLKADSVEVGSDISLVVSSIVSGIDTDVLDNQRKMNAGYRKFLQDQKKK